MISVRIKTAPPSDNPTFFPSDYWQAGQFLISLHLQPIKKTESKPTTADPVFHHNMGLGSSLAPCHTAMITVFMNYFNTFSQKSYEKTIFCLNIFSLTCTCGRKGSLVLYGSYKRHLKVASILSILKIQRVKCRECGKTHALMPFFLVPYSQVSQPEQKQLIEAVLTGKGLENLLESNTLIDENYVKYLIRKYRKHWEQRLLAIHLALQDHLTAPCLSHYLKQFMQVRNTPNTFFSLST